MQYSSVQSAHQVQVCEMQGLKILSSVQSEMVCLRVLMGTVMVLTAVIYGTEVWVENRIAVDSYIEPAGAAKKKKVPFTLIQRAKA